jgi:hypothetical protein
VVDDRFALIPWDLPLDGWLRDVRGGGAFPEEARSLLARMSAGSRPAWQGQAGAERPSSPTKAWGSGGRRGRKKGP